MALQCRGHDIMTLGEFTEMVKGLDPEATGTGTLQAWLAGEQVGPLQLQAELDVVARLSARSGRARELIEQALARLEELFPEDVAQR